VREAAVNHPLGRALRGAGLHVVDVAAQLAVDPKTVQRWISGRIPYPRHRAALTRLTGWTSRDLWPDLPRKAEPNTVADEVRLVYPHRSAVPPDAWTRLLRAAQHDIGILGYSALFLAEDPAVHHVLRDKARAGARVRIALGDPDGAQIAHRGHEERIGDGMGARIRNALVGFMPLASEPGISVRMHDTVLYNSMVRADDELLINTHLYGRPAAHAPVLHLKGTRADGMVATYLASFERVWSTSRRVTR
jgi:hypothetical protein